MRLANRVFGLTEDTHYCNITVSSIDVNFNDTSFRSLIWQRSHCLRLGSWNVEIGGVTKTRFTQATCTEARAHQLATTTNQRNADPKYALAHWHNFVRTTPVFFIPSRGHTAHRKSAWASRHKRPNWKLVGRSSMWVHPDRRWTAGLVLVC
jgi:hypothetical protein